MSREGRHCQHGLSSRDEIESLAGGSKKKIQKCYVRDGMYRLHPEDIQTHCDEDS